MSTSLLWGPGRPTIGKLGADWALARPGGGAIGHCAYLGRGAFPLPGYFPVSWFGSRFPSARIPGSARFDRTGKRARKYLNGNELPTIWRSILRPEWAFLRGFSRSTGKPRGGAPPCLCQPHDRRYRRFARAATSRNGGRRRSSAQFGWAAICSSVGPHSSIWSMEKPSPMSMLI
jgi:hypothetical protein